MKQLTPGEAAVNEAIEKAELFLAGNPWLAVAGAAVASQVFAAMSQKTPIRHQSSRAAMRDWLDDAYSSLPTKKQFQSVAKSAGVPTNLRQLRKKLTG